MVGILKHELGHAIAFELGLPGAVDSATKEELANKIADVFSSTGRLVHALRTLLDESGAGEVDSNLGLERRYDAGKLPFNNDALDCGNHMPKKRLHMDFSSCDFSVTINNGRVQ
jgi:hypothetical protein